MTHRLRRREGRTVNHIIRNIIISLMVSRIALLMSRRHLLHFGSDTEEILLPSSSNMMQGEMVAPSAYSDSM
jgi:hypothetical protein